MFSDECTQMSQWTNHAAFRESTTSFSLGTYSRGYAMELFMHVLFPSSRNIVVWTDAARECGRKPTETYEKHHRFSNFEPKDSILLLDFSGELLLTVDPIPSLLVCVFVLFTSHEVLPVKLPCTLV